MAEILVVDDDQSIASAFERFLKHEGHVCTLASNAEEALRLAGERDPDLVVMDIRMPGTDGLDVLQQLRSRRPELYVVMMTAYGTSQTSIDAIRAGAFEYLTKPLDLDQLRLVIRKALAAKASRTRAAQRDGQADEPPPSTGLVGDVPAMQEVYKMIGRLAVNDVPALVTGEHGTGKALVVATIHDNSARRDEPFVTLDCATLPETALESELFGHEAGTIHVASIHALTKTLQARLTRAMGESHGRLSARAGAPVRILASTDARLLETVESGAFSRELYDLLAVITIRLPPLRERLTDIPLLVRHVVARVNEELNRSITGVDEQVLYRFQAHSWPGNVAELQSVLKRACMPGGACGLAGAAGRERQRVAILRLSRHRQHGGGDPGQGGARHHQRQSGEGIGAAGRQPGDAAEEGEPGVARPVIGVHRPRYATHPAAPSAARMTAAGRTLPICIEAAPADA
jgi:DNA-binding NtrC family response regulator